MQNPALAIRDWLVEAFGTERVDEQSFLEAAKYCDELVPLPGGESGAVSAISNEGPAVTAGAGLPDPQRCPNNPGHPPDGGGLIVAPEDMYVWCSLCKRFHP